MGKILDFYEGIGKNQYGFSFDDMIRMSDVNIENSHTCIQWLFPLFEESMATPNSPILSDDEIETFRKAENHHLRRKLVVAADRMCAFYGLEIVIEKSGGVDSHIRIIKAQDWMHKSSNWLTPRNHNFKRLTRMARSLSLLGLDALSVALQDCLLVIAKESSAVNSVTETFWKEARVF